MKEDTDNIDARKHGAESRERVSEAVSPPTERLNHFFPDFQRRFDLLMKSKGVSHSQLAREASLSRPTLARIASGEANPVVNNLMRLAEVLGTRLNDLLGPQAGEGLVGPKDRPASAFLAAPPRGDPRAMDLYSMACEARAIEELHDEVERLQFQRSWETADQAIARAVVDVFYYRNAWIDHTRFDRDTELETEIFKRYQLRIRKELRDDVIPVRVIELPPNLVSVLRIHAVAAMAASIVKALVAAHYSILGFSDGFAASTVQRFLRRGDLAKAELVPLVHTPRFVQYELSCAALTGSFARSHDGYAVRSSMELKNLQERLDRVELAFLSCGSAEKEPDSRIGRLIRDARPKTEYNAFVQSLKEKKVVGDLMYHFLNKDGTVEQTIGSARNLEGADFKAEFTDSGASEDETPLVYSASLDCLAGIAERGVSLLLVHSDNRAAVVHAALQRQRKPINYIVTTKTAAERLLSLS